MSERDQKEDTRRYSESSSSSSEGPDDSKVPIEKSSSMSQDPSKEELDLGNQEASQAFSLQMSAETSIPLTGECQDKTTEIVQEVKEIPVIVETMHDKFESGPELPEKSRLSPEPSQDKSSDLSRESSEPPLDKSLDLSRESSEFPQEKTLDQSRESTEPHQHKSPDLSRESSEPFSRSPDVSSESSEPTRESPVQISGKHEEAAEPSLIKTEVIANNESKVNDVVIPEVTLNITESSLDEVMRDEEISDHPRDSPDVVVKSVQLCGESVEEEETTTELNRTSSEIDQSSQFAVTESESFIGTMPTRDQTESDLQSEKLVEQKSRSLSTSSSSSEEAEQARQPTVSSSEVEETTDYSSSKQKDSSVTESSFNQQPELRQDTLDEVEEESVPEGKQAFQIQHATEQEVDDLVEAVSSSTPCDVKVESKTPPPSPIVKPENQEVEGLFKFLQRN